MSIRVSLQEQYQHASDEELRRLAEDYNDLMPDAQQALFAELQSRGLRQHIDTARSVEAEAAIRAAGPNYFVIADAGEKMPGSFQVLVPRGPLRFPASCPGCGNPADKKCPVVATHLSAAKFNRLETLMYQVPHCAACARNTTRSTMLTAVVLIAALAALAVPLSLWLGLPAALGILLTAMLVIIGIRRGRAPLGAPEGIFLLDYDENSVSFVFKSRVYAEKFCAINLQSVGVAS
ncbi:MAG TPA: hypothetical protein VK812_06610 [Candidatus Binatus sp.]|jgi:hypothetical protein|nr:hypothetical protein [Candidatus Binatus sp.]